MGVVNVTKEWDMAVASLAQKNGSKQNNSHAEHLLTSVRLLCFL